MDLAKIFCAVLIATGAFYPQADSQSCLEHCWNQVCSSIGNMVSGDLISSCCPCILNLPSNDIGPVERINCTNILGQYRDSDYDSCCGYVLNASLESYQLVTPENAQCTIETIFKDDLTGSTTPSTLQKQTEYIVPSFTFDCTGCIERVEMLSTGSGITSETVTIHLWRRYQRDNIDDLYERRSTATIMAIPTVDPAANDLMKITLSLSNDQMVCFESGDVLGLSLPFASSLNIVLGSEDSVYRVDPNPTNTCNELEDLFEPSDGNRDGGAPEIAVVIGPSPTSTLPTPTRSDMETSGSSTIRVTPSEEPQPQTIQMPAVTIQMTPASTPGTGNETSGSGTGTPGPGTGSGDDAETKQDPILDYIPIIAAGGGGLICILLLVVLIVGLLICINRRRRRKMEPEIKLGETGGVVNHIPTDGRLGKPNASLCSIRSPMMETIMGSKLTEENSTSLDKSKEPLYDLPEELCREPHTEVKNPIYHTVSGATSESPQAPRGNIYQQRSSTYIPMEPAGSISNDVGQDPTINSEEELEFHASRKRSYTGYDDPKELGIPRISDYDVPTALMKPKAHVYHILENSEFEAAASGKPFYHILEPGPSGERITHTTSSGQIHHYHILESGSPDQDETTGQRRQSLLESGSLDRRPSRRVVFDCGIYVPNAEERRQLSGGTEPSVSTEIYDTWSKAKRQESRKKRGFFEETKTYWVPADSASKLYDQFARKKFREILRNQITVIDHLGAGQFGSVVKAKWEFPGGEMEVAVKMMRPSALEGAKVNFLREAAVMGQFFHPNVIRLHGVVTVGDPAMIVIELMPEGDLGAFLKKNHSPGLHPPPTPLALLSYCRQIACGMKYLSKKNYVHRDLAARNILLSENHVCKISDFGMSRGLDDSNYYVSKGGQVPIKWTAPEALLYKKYSTASDVYSYGMVLYELWSLGLRPLSDIPFHKVATVVSEGYCQPPPPGCPREIYQLMVKCWNPDYNQRPHFTEITEYLTASDDSLLSWSSQDKKVSERAMELGAPLDETNLLYKDLQHVYHDE